MSVDETAFSFIAVASSLMRRLREEWLTPKAESVDVSVRDVFEFPNKDRIVKVDIKLRDDRLKKILVATGFCYIDADKKKASCDIATHIIDEEEGSHDGFHKTYLVDILSGEAREMIKE